MLDSAPTLYGSGAGTPLSIDAADDAAATADARPPSASGSTTSAGRVERRDVREILEDRAPDQEVARMAQRIASRLVLRRRPRDRHAEGRAASARPMPYRYRSDDIDLDRTIEVLSEKAHLDDTDVIVREPVRTRRTVVLVVDVSGSMRGEKVRIAAATVAALAGDLPADRLALVAFWSDAAVLSPLDRTHTAPTLLDMLLRIKARGLTNVHFGLSVAETELAGAPSGRRTAILLTDAVHNAGPDPRLLARRFPELHVLLQADGENDAGLARDLARLGRGTVRPVRTHRDVAPALNAVFDRPAPR